MALVDVLDPFVRRRGTTARGVGHEAVRVRDAHSSAEHESVARLADARWAALSPGLDCGRAKVMLARKEAQYGMVFERGDLIGVICECDFFPASPSDPIFSVMSRRI